jgi:hypothetical protein
MQDGNIQKAIIWTKDLEELHEGKRAAESCPHTKVYVLVEKLLSYIEKDMPKTGGYTVPKLAINSQFIS